MKVQKNNYLKSLIVAGIFIAATSSCKRDALESITGQQTGPYSSMQDFYNQNGVQPQTFTFNADNPYIIPGNRGTQIYIPGNSLVDSVGNHATGNVKATLKEIYNIKDMILSNVPTTSGGSILQSGGMFYLEFSANNIQYRPDTTIIASLPTDSVSIFQNMYVFFGVTDSSGFNWGLADTTVNYVYNNINNSTFNLILDSIGYGWINCDLFYYSQPLTSVIITPAVTSEHYESVNLAVYLAFPSINSCMNVYSSSVQQSVTAYSIPVGMQAAAVIIGTGRVTKKPYFGFTIFTVTSGQPVNVSVVQTDEAQIISALQTL
ncbi:MAG TPA: hypothetical protein VI757_02575 [Bacteroidia bacterium]|nr:hypothetical protein [Bacteroidia bacterium]